MAHKFDWDDLRVLLAVAEAGSVNAAARTLGLNHATVLRRVAAFEERSGVALFARGPRGYRLDPGAGAVIAAIREVDGAVDAVTRALAGADQGPAGEVAVTTTDSLAIHVLPRLLTELRAAHPGLTIRLATSNERLDLGKGAADLTIRPAEAAPQGLIADRAATMRFSVWGARAYLADRQDAEIAAHDWLATGEALAASPAGAFSAQLPSASVALRASSFVTLASAAAAGMGLAMLPDFVAEQTPGLRRARRFDDRRETGVWVAAHPDLATAPAVAVCRAFFARALAADPAFA